MSSELIDTVASFIETEVLDSGVRIGPDTGLISGEVLDSLGILSLVGFLEDEFEVEIAPGDVTVENFENLARIAQLVERKRAEG